MKKRTLTISLIVLAIMLLVGIGYAGWVITRSDSGVADGSFTAYSVSDNGALDVQTTDPNVVFGYDGSPADAWLTYTDVAAQDLTAEFTVSWSGGAQSFTLAHSFFTGTLGTAETPVTPSTLLIGGPTFSIKTAVTGVSLSVDGTTLSFDGTYTAYVPVTIVVTYKFGTLFNEQNPNTFFNGKGVNEAAFDGSSNYKGYTTSNIALSSINSELSSSLLATSTYADVANVALSKLNDLVGNGTLKFKVAVSKAA